MKRDTKKFFRWLLLHAFSCLLAVALPAPAQEARQNAGYFGVYEKDGVSWLVTPEGKPFLSLGVNVLDRGGSSRKKKTAAGGEYVASAFYPTPDAWADATLKRLHSWGFNTLGGWSDAAVLNRRSTPPMPYTVALQLGSTQGFPWDDPFGRAFEQGIDGQVREQVLPLRDDPHLIGWFTDNELNWWDQTIFAYHISETKPTATRRVLLDLIRKHYGGDFEKLRVDFDPKDAKSFADLETASQLKLRGRGGGDLVVGEFISALADRYYRCVHDAIRRYDSHHLILGDRYQNYYSPAVVRAAAPHVDVISSNFFCRGWDDGDLARFFTDGLHQLSGKPVLISEFYFCAHENSSGNKNRGGDFPVVQTQAQRAAAFSQSVQSLAASRHVVGMHWYQYYDEPTNGAPDSESFNMGLIDIHDKPYDLLTATATVENARLAELHALAGKTPRPAGAPPPAADPLSGWAGWDRHRSFISPEAGVPFADLYAFADDKNVYLAVCACDFLDKDAYSGKDALASDQMVLSVRLAGWQNPTKITLGPSGPAHLKDPPTDGTDRKIRLKSWKESTRYTLLIAIPNPPASGPVKLEASLSRHDLPTPMQWKATVPPK